MKFAYSETAEAIRIALGSVLRTRREAARRSLSELAAEAGLSPEHLSGVERGRKEISTERLVAVAHALAIPPAEFFFGHSRLLDATPGDRAWPLDPPIRQRSATTSLPLD